ncbi:hypothetical protein ANANG_G00214890 [Anguilla anguilla]|uniref:Uncharacterized protein n=1 Tax=Anguilla anguilla TaxID=7936 RepID=A0A9D3RRI0_ANGAN|nr:hypothetical protein ANANG_G00214890 [Anguilla anguilla]
MKKEEGVKEGIKERKTVLHENPRRAAVSLMLEPPHLAPSIWHSQSRLDHTSCPF